MKTKTLAATLALAAGLAVAGTAQAEGKIYVGVKGGLMMANYSGFNDAINAGIYGGFNLLGQDAQYAADLKGGTLAVEGELSMSASKGKLTNDVGASGKWENTSVALFAAYRYPLNESFYLKGKAGVAHDDISTTVPSAHDKSTDKLALGVGGGWKVGPGSLEAEFTTHEGDINFLSVGFHMSF